MSVAKKQASLQAGSNNLEKNNTTEGVKYQTTSSSMVKEKLFKLPDGNYGYIIVNEYDCFLFHLQCAI
jgi:hypothetical protein